MPENKYQRIAKLLWMLFILLIAVTIVMALFILSRSNTSLNTDTTYQQIVLNADSITGKVAELGANFIRLTGDDNIYFYDANTNWIEKDVKANVYVDAFTGLNAGDRVLLKIDQSGDDFYIYEVRKEPVRSLAGMVIAIQDNVLTVQDWQNKSFEVIVSADTQYFLISGQGVNFAEIVPGNEIIVTSFGEDLDNIIRAELIEVVN